MQDNTRYTAMRLFKISRVATFSTLTRTLPRLLVSPLSNPSAAVLRTTVKTTLMLLPMSTLLRAPTFPGSFPH